MNRINHKVIEIEKNTEFEKLDKSIEELELEEKWNYIKKLLEGWGQLSRKFHKDNDGNYTRESDIVVMHASKMGCANNLSLLNEKTKQLAKDIFPLSGCGCRDNEGCFSADPVQGTGSGLINFHILNCLKTRREIEEFCQRVNKRDEEMTAELVRAAMEDEETVKKADEIRKNRSCPCYRQEQNKNDVSNKQLTSTSNEKQDDTEQSLITVDQEKSNSNVTNNPKGKQSKTTKQNKERKEESSLIKRDNTDNNEQKKIHNEEGNKESNNMSSSIDKTTKSENNNYLISIGLLVAIISTVFLVVFSALWIARKQKSPKRIKTGK